MRDPQVAYIHAEHAAGQLGARRGPLPRARRSLLVAPGTMHYSEPQRFRVGAAGAGAGAGAGTGSGNTKVHPRVAGMKNSDGTSKPLPSNC